MRRRDTRLLKSSILKAYCSFPMPKHTALFFSLLRLKSKIEGKRATGAFCIPYAHRKIQAHRKEHIPPFSGAQENTLLEAHRCEEGEEEQSCMLLKSFWYFFNNQRPRRVEHMAPFIILMYSFLPSVKIGDFKSHMRKRNILFTAHRKAATGAFYYPKCLKKAHTAFIFCMRIEGIRRKTGCMSILRLFQAHRKRARGAFCILCAPQKKENKTAFCF